MPKRARLIGAALLLAVLASLAVHLIFLLPMLARFLARPAEPEGSPKPVEITWEPERHRPRSRPALTRSRPMALAEQRLAQRPKPKRQPRRRAAPPRTRPRVFPRVRPRPIVRHRPRAPRPRPRPRPRRRAPPRPRVRPVKLRIYHMKMVDQDNKRNEPPPRDARFLAQRNRDVRHQTRARHTNLDRHSSRTNLRSRAPKKVGSLTREPKTEARQLRRAAKERAGAPRRARARPRRLLRAQRPAQPRARPRRSSLLSMRNRRPHQDRELLEPKPAPLSPQGTLAIRQRPPRRPKPSASRATARAAPRRRLRLRLTPQDADRVFGAQWAAEWKARNRRRGSRGPKSQRWKRIQAALENYVPEVREGNQTALKTRAHPYAAYIAAMHRKIHPLWGDGFLVDLDRMPAHDKFNDWSRFTKLELVLDNQGRVIKAGVVKPSGFLPFDVAALDVVFQAAPFGPPPRAILSYDGRVYLHWRFHRDQRQCGTFGVDPFILAGPKERRDHLRGGGQVREGRTGRALRRRGGAAAQPPRSVGGGGAGRARGLDVRARGPAAAWIVGFQQSKTDRMLRASALPFFVSGRPVRGLRQLESIYRALILETPNRRLGRPVQLLTAAGLRQRIGTLPRGVRPGTGQLYVVARYGSDDLVLVLDRRGQRWAVVGIAR